MAVSDFTPSGAVLDIVGRLLPYSLAAAVGAGCAWYIQGLRLTAANQEFQQYKLDAREKVIDAEIAAQKQREQAKADYEKSKTELQKQVDAGEVWRRCVAAGKCGRLSDKPTSGVQSVPAAGGVNAAASDGISIAPVVSDCALTTLQLDRLQKDIANQPGY